MKKRITAALWSLALLVWLSGCSSVFYQKEQVETEDQYVVGVVTKSNSSEFWMSVNSGMEDAAKKFDMKVITLAPDSELDKEVQEKQAERLIRQGVDAIAISPINSYEIPDYMEEIQEKNLPAVAFDTGFEGNPLPYIGIDNHKVGYELAKELAAQMDHRGQVGIVSGDLDQMGHRERVEGFKEYMETEPEITVKFTESGYANLQMSEQKVREIMKKYPDVTGIFATSAVTAMGLTDELSDSGIKIVTVDEQEDSLKALQNGEIAALAAQSGYEIGYETIHYIQELRDGQENETNFIDVKILTQDSVKEGEKQ